MGNYIQTMYERWLIERVLIHGWTTNRCAREINHPEPEQVEKDFDRALRYLPSYNSKDAD